MISLRAPNQDTTICSLKRFLCMEVAHCSYLQDVRGIKNRQTQNLPSVIQKNRRGVLSNTPPELRLGGIDLTQLSLASDEFQSNLALGIGLGQH